MKPAVAGAKTFAPAAAVTPPQADGLKEQEQSKYAEIWRMPGYRRVSPAFRDIDNIRAWIDRHGIKRVVDFGCGKGQMDLALARDGVEVHMIDIANNCLDRDVREAVDRGELTFEQKCLWEPGVEKIDPPVDGVICIDLLEHLPPEKVAKVIRKIKLVAPHGYINAALFPHEVAGQVLHLTVREADWWTRQFPEAQSRISAEFHDLGNTAESHVYMEW